ncbi:hypothetical protein AgCh_009540 [Apium graveolens]
MTSCHKLRVDLKEINIEPSAKKDNAHHSMNSIFYESSNSTSIKFVNKKKVIWIIDSGCSIHMTGDIALLSQFEEKNGPLVTFGDNNKDLTVGYDKLISGNVVIQDVALVAGLETGEVALKGAREGSLFVADLDSINEDGICFFYIKASVELSKLWHKKLSHLNLKEINTLVKKELVRDMPNQEFAQDETRALLKNFSAARTPQQNGVVERKNRTLVEAARTMLQDSKLPTRFWEEAVNTACYTQNKYVINKNLGKSPYSILSKRKPTVKHLHVFGSKCYILKDNSGYVGKFDSKVFEAIFLGYSLERTAYKVYVIEQKKIMESTDVTFDDDKCPSLECLHENEAEAPKFENLNIDSNSDEEAEVTQITGLMKCPLNK